MSRRRTKTEIEAIKRDFKDKCCFKKDPIPTKEVFKLLGFTYSNTNDRDFIYRWVSTWVEETLLKIWNFEFEEGDKDKIYEGFLEKCWIEKEPFGYFDGGLFYTPRTYGEYEALLNKYAIGKIIGMGTAVLKMANKGMLLNSKIPAKQLLESLNDINKLLDISERSLIEYKEEEEKEEIIEDVEEIIEDIAKNKEIKEALEKMDQQMEEMAKTREAFKKKFLDEEEK